MKVCNPEYAPEGRFAMNAGDIRTGYTLPNTRSHM